MLARDRGDHAAALAVFRIAREQAPDDASIGLEFARALASAERPAEARRLLASLNARDPALRGGWLALAELERDHDPAAARAAYARALALREEAPVLVAAARIAADDAAAEALFGRACALAPDDPQILLAAAEHAWQRDATEAAIALLRHAIAVRPDAAAPRARLAHALAETGALEEGLALLGDDTRPARVALLALAGDWPAALAAAAGPADDFSLGYQRAAVLLALGAWDRFDAEVAAAPATTAHQRADVLRLAGEAAEARWDHAGAQSLLDQATALNPRDAWAHTLAARMRLMRFDVAGARASLGIAAGLGAEAARRRGQATHVSQSHLGQLLDEFRLDAGLLAELAGIAGLPAEVRIALLGPLVRDNPGHTPAAMALLLALRQSGGIGGAGPACAAIPRRIMQYWDEASPPDDVARLMQGWAALHPGFAHVVYDDAAARDWLARYAAPEVGLAYRRAREPAARCDIFRLAVLQAEGGIYADADDRCVAPFDLDGVGFLGYQEEYATLGNNILACVPGHPVIGLALGWAVAAVNRGDSDILWLRTGPGLLTRAFATCIVRETPLPGRQVMLERHELRRHVAAHSPAAYKRTPRHWVRSLFRVAAG